MAWNSTPHTPPHTIYRLIKPEKKTTCGTGTYFMQHLACLWIMHMDVTLCFNSNFTTPLNAQKKITHFNFSFGNFCQLINMSIWMEKGLLIRLKENLLLFSPQRTSKAHTSIYDWLINSPLPFLSSFQYSAKRQQSVTRALFCFILVIPKWLHLYVFENWQVWTSFIFRGGKKLGQVPRVRFLSGHLNISLFLSEF